MPHLANRVNQVLETCDVCGAFDKAPHVPIAGTATVSAFNEKVQADLLFLDDLIVAHAMDVFSKYSENPQEVWGVSCARLFGTFGPPKRIQMGEGGEWKDEI